MSLTLSAHQRDEYLQAARIAIDPVRVELELDLTPGIALADAAIAEIDGDGDGALSPDEQQACARRVMSAIQLALDSRPLPIDLVASTFPELSMFRGGEGTIQLRLAAVLPSSADGAHQLTFRNTYRRDVSVYLANALAPENRRVVVTAQRRDPEQRELTIDYRVRADRGAPPPLWPLGVIALAAAAAARRFHGRAVRPRP